ncbi:acylneuraminate cytidylyltransferase family protein [Clostridium tagluense]|uniref:acylneuraminate cytidylyltransferase family protein n=1 Tax=Clostridium tagluense TaxID=360422 RepID=UPI001C0BEE06|nr:acylneuraminate cytidylyltransferase family protein [Clostridium tagluense]MBU3126096.1 acylneuraminate cytidylyltransferase family protein [Clostridium tagluense]MCB2299664.1 acylneuraminate cytidylyltransferase family protein [Clostridium tagluense]MCB2311696.1 acylneuraminate cytidylyltransferase family protein [Clostridium tagluense]MCB2316420.1 acylneuraminate cytidylyltransferase family protein [Clostridium tagluense]MCB2321195.1 acylneuraminate cytidylyltransferase family protein [Cl
MYKNKRFLAIIPARGGSKGIPNKNVMAICGKPLIAYTIEAGKKSKYIDEIIVSTDSDVIKVIAQQYGAVVPFLRPEELSSDSAKSIDVVIHAIDFYKNNNIAFDYVILLQPTSPLRTFEHLDKAIEKIIESNRTSLVSVCEAEENPILMRNIENDKLKEVISFEGTNLRRQDLPTFYIFNGALYINSTDMLVDEKKFVNEDTIPYVMDKESSVDIDTMLDARLVELIIKESMDV